jgi:hypothetical protein
VSRLFPDRLLIGLAPDAVSLLRASGGAKPRVLEKRVLACDHSGKEPWEDAGAALSRLAGELGKASARVTVVLSNHFTRYALVPWSEGLGKADEEVAFARYCFAKIHGERSKNWDLRLSAGPQGTQRMASAVDAPLVQAVRSAFPGKARLVSVQPYLMSAFNRFRRQLAGARAWLLLAEPQRTCLARLEEGRWTAVRNWRGDLDAPEHWAGLLDRERHLVGGDPAAEEVYVHGATGWNESSVRRDGWTFRSLLPAAVAGLAAGDSERFAMPLCAL